MKVSVMGIDLEVEFDFQPKEKQTWFEPGCEESVDLTKVTVPNSNVNVSTLLSDDVYKDIEIRVLEQIKKTRCDDEMDFAIDNHLNRRWAA